PIAPTRRDEITPEPDATIGRRIPLSHLPHHRRSPVMRRAPAFLLLLFLTPVAAGQGTKADYDRANSVRQWSANKVFKDKVETNWTADGNTFWYRNDLAGGKKEFVLVDAAKGTREVVTEDKLPKDTKPLVVPPKKKFGKDEEEASEFFEDDPEPD